MKNYGIWAVLVVVVVMQGCQSHQTSGQTPAFGLLQSKSFAMTPEQFRVAINQKMTLAGLTTLPPLELNNQFFTVGHIAEQQITLEGKVNADGQLNLLRYRSYLVDEKSLRVAMTLIKNTAQVLPPMVSEQDKDNWIEQVMEDAVASPDNFAEKEVQRHIIYSATSQPNGMFEVSYRILN